MHYLYIVIAAVLWGVDGQLRSSLYSLPPAIIVFWEHCIGFLILSVPLLLSKQAPYKKQQQGNTAALVMVISLLSGLIGTLAITAALARVHFIPLSIVFLIQKLQPIFTITSAWVVLGERPKKQFWFWATTAVIAGYFMTFPGGRVNIDTNSSYVAAAMFALIAAIAWGSSTVFSIQLLKKKSLLPATFMRFSTTTIFALATVFLFGQQSQLLQITLPQLGTLVFIACSTGMMALLIYYKGLQRVPAHISCILELAYPITGLLIDTQINHVVLSLSQYVAAALLILCIYKVVDTNRAPQIP